MKDGESVPYGIKKDEEPVCCGRAGACSRRAPKGFHSASIDAKRLSIGFGGTKAPPYGVNGGSFP